MSRRLITYIDSQLNQVPANTPSTPAPGKPAEKTGKKGFVAKINDAVDQTLQTGSAGLPSSDSIGVADPGSGQPLKVSMGRKILIVGAIGASLFLLYQYLKTSK